MCYGTGGRLLWRTPGLTAGRTMGEGSFAINTTPEQNKTVIQR
jgi:hypothetical protein